MNPVFFLCSQSELTVIVQLSIVRSTKTILMAMNTAEIPHVRYGRIDRNELSSIIRRGEILPWRGLSVHIALRQQRNVDENRPTSYISLDIEAATEDSWSCVPVSMNP